MIEIFDKSNLEILLHCFLDGRDSFPISGVRSMKSLMRLLKQKKYRLQVFLEGFFLWIEIIDGIG